MAFRPHGSRGTLNQASIPSAAKAALLRGLDGGTEVPPFQSNSKNNSNDKSRSRFPAGMTTRKAATRKARARALNDS